MGDSCDASGEYTTEDDEIEARIEEVTDSIQDLDATLVNDSNSCLDTSPCPPDLKVRKTNIFNCKLFLPYVPKFMNF